MIPVKDKIVFECLAPCVNSGDFPAKCETGDFVDVEADIFHHGHDILAAVLLHCPPGSRRWHEVPLRESGNDRWAGGFSVEALGLHEFALAAWVDEFASWRRATERKQAAGQDLASDLIEGAALANTICLRARGEDATILRAAAETADAAALLAANVADAAARWPDPAVRQRSEKIWTVRCERQRSRFGAWYEMFPRSQGTAPGRSGSFAECEARLPEIAAMGFDVVYLPPIHPIGRTKRKGRNNSLVAAPGDPGSPYAIGSEQGGHDAVEAGLGTLADFDHFVAACHALQMEVALDFAINCSPDHPWVREHPEWFFHRPDGSIKHAENPPKRYEDIYPLDLEGPAAESLWHELLRVLQFWIEHGVRIFRVDNPHTKPFPLWTWLLDKVWKRHPDVVFLSEAFTRPKPMKRLAKLGFSQSYTYFTWRNTKQELTEYLCELALGPSRNYFRPNFFVNTPDILPDVLQRGGRPAFLQRLVLAATLSPSWGMYNGFELCENRALPNSEEYANSEKYEFKVWDWNREGHIKDMIARVNLIRREHPALQRIAGLQFLHAENPQMLLYARFDRAKHDVLVVAVNLDPFSVQQGPIEIPGPELGVGESFAVEDLLSGPRGVWRGRSHYLRLDPAGMPAVLFHLRPAE